MRFPEGTVISPTYATNGEKVASSFTIWQELVEAPKADKVLIEA